MLGKADFKVWWGLSVLLCGAVLPVQAANPAADDLVVVSECDDRAAWAVSGDLDVSVQPDDRRPDNRVLCVSYKGRGNRGSGAIQTAVPEVALTQLHAFSFQLRGPRADARASLWVDLICQNGAWFRMEESVSNFEWSQIVLVPQDFRGWSRASNQNGEAPDWTKIRSVRFRVTDGPVGEQGNILIDKVIFRKMVPAAPAPGPAPAEVIVIDECDDAGSWKAEGPLKLSVQGRQTGEGRCIRLSHTGGRGSGLASVIAPETLLSRSHVLTFGLRCGLGAGSRLRLRLSSDDGVWFEKELGIGTAEWADVFLVPSDFQAVEPNEGAMGDFASIRSLNFVVENERAGGNSDVRLDSIAFRKLHVTGPRNPDEDQSYWWWDGGWDPFLARHASSGDWAHRQDRPQHDAPMKFDRSILSPYMPYTVYLHNDEAYERIMLTITDWRLTPIKVINLTRPRKGIIQINLAAPALCGTYLLNLERYGSAGMAKTAPERYQTGITVVAKRLSEPSGIWGIEAAAARSNEDPDAVMDMFQALGVMGLRMSNRPPSQWSQKYLSEDHSKHMALHRAAKARDIALLSIINPGPKITAVIGRGDFLGPDLLDPFLKDVEDTTRVYKDLMDWYELGNEMNERPLAPYADMLKKSYAAAKRGDPDARLIMCGSGPPDEWQKGLWKIEQAEEDPRYATYQDAVASHLYPDLQGVEPTLRYRLYERIGEDTLRAKGHLMTEAGWPALMPKLQALLRNGLLPRDYSGELDYQCWLGMYMPTILGEHQKMGAALHGVYFFRAVTALKYKYIYDADGNYIHGELAMPSEGYFVNRGLVNAGGDWRISVARPFAYTHNTVARLLTHEVQRTSVEVRWDRAEGNVESYAFRRPGETIVAAWIGPPLRSRMGDWQQQPRAEQLDITVKVPGRVAMVVAVDLDGNERVVPMREGIALLPQARPPMEISVNVVDLRLTRPPDLRDGAGQLLWPRGGQPTFLRLLDGRRVGNVFFQNLEHMPDGPVRIVKGTPEGNGELLEGVSRDRNLPAIGAALPVPGSPMVLYSRADETVYIVGRTEADVMEAEQALNAFVAPGP